MRSAIILAAGKGTRMKSNLVKPMHKVLDKPMVEHIVCNLKKANVDRIVTVVGYGAETVTTYLKDKCEFAVQAELNGSGGAVRSVTQLNNEDGYTLVVNGDGPLVQPETFEMMFKEVEGCGALVLSSILPEGLHYGRVIRDNEGNFLKITEAKDCNELEKKVNEINTGMYAFDNKLLFEYLPLLSDNNAQKELYITDMIQIMKEHGHKVKAIAIKDPDEGMGINDRYELYLATKWLQKKINKEWMLKGVTIIDPEATYISTDAIIGEDTIIYPNTRIEGATTIGKNNILEGDNKIVNASIGDNNLIQNVEITDSKIGSNCKIGPFVRLRNNCDIQDNTRIGNFVEMKNTKFGEGSKCAHLTYLGDTTVGKNCNFGCGTVTVNYDGVNKFHTEIEDNVFIGCNANLIAPVTIRKGSVIAAGTTVTKDVEEDAMAIGRVRQENKKDYGRIYLNKEGK